MSARVNGPPVEGHASVACHIDMSSGAPVGVALLIHGRDGKGRSDHMLPVAQAYNARGWITIAPDLPRSRATPGFGDPEAFTMTGHVRDALAILSWLRDNREFAASNMRIAVAGHSMGAYAAARLAADHDVLDHVLAISPVLSGARLMEARIAMGPSAVETMQREAPALVAELADHDATVALGAIASPVGVVSGELDGITPPSTACAYLRAANWPCFLSILPGQHHCPQGDSYARALSAALDALKA